MLAVLLVVGLIIGAGAGYMLAPKEIIQEGETVVETEIIERAVYKETMWTWIAVLLGGGSLGYDVLQEDRFQKWKAYVNDKIDLFDRRTG